MCAAVLGVANSALYRRAVAVHSVRTAVTLLGLRQVASLAVGVACRALFDMEVRVQHDLYPVWWNRLFHGAMTEAFAASFVAIERRLGASDAVFLAGMFHDIGKSLVLRSLSAQLVNGAILGIPDDAAIEELLRRLHVPIGVAALRTWNLPEPIARVCETQRDDHVPDGRDWVDAHVIRIVSSLNDLRMGMLETAEPLSIIADSARALDLGRADILAVAGQVSEHAAQVGVLFSVADPADESGYIDFVTRCIEVG
jgi:HD-like signal output (HDOD) protein